MRLKLAIAAVCAATLLAAPSASAQLQPGDLLLASTAGINHFRNLSDLVVTPVAGDGNTIAQSSFGNGALLYIPNTQFVVMSQASSPFRVYLLDFSTSVTAPTSFLLGTAASGIINSAFDPQTGSVFLLRTGGTVSQIPGPISSLSTISATPFATGLPTIQAIEVVAGGQLIGANATTLININAGNTAPNPPFLTFIGAGCNDLAYDASSNRVFTSGFGSSRIDAYDLGTNTHINTIIQNPQITVCDAVDYDPSTDRVYGLSRIQSSIGGAPYGAVPASFDNVIVCNLTTLPSSAAQGCSPPAGHSNNAQNATMVLVRPESRILNFNPATASLTFNTGAGTVSASGTVTSLSGASTVTTPAGDPLVGATVTLSANFTGADTVSFTDIALSNVVIDIFQTTTPPGTPDETIAATGSNNAGAVSSFGGSLGVTPLAVRRLVLQSLTPTSNGGTSAILAAIHANIMTGGNVSVDFDVTTGGLASIGLNVNSIAASFETRVGTSLTGDFELGSLGAEPGVQLFHLFTAQLAIPTGSGSFLGLAADLQLFNQLLSPVGTQPFSVFASLNGLYRFTLPSGTLPAGLQVDYLGIEYDFINVQVNLSGPKTITF